MVKKTMTKKKQQLRKSNKKQQQTPFDKVSRLVKKVQQKDFKKKDFPYMKLCGILILLGLIIMISVLIVKNNNKMNPDDDE